MPNGHRYLVGEQRSLSATYSQFRNKHYPGHVCCIDGVLIAAGENLVALNQWPRYGLFVLPMTSTENAFRMRAIEKAFAAAPGARLSLVRPALH